MHFDLLPLAVGAVAGIGNGVVVKASSGGKHPVLFPAIYEGALLVGGGALDYFGVNPDIGTSLMIVGGALLAARALYKVAPTVVTAGYVAVPSEPCRPGTPPAASYRARALSVPMPGVWQDERDLIYRTGAPGDYPVGRVA